ncbi:MAG: glycosyltransferase family 2 protein, partial [Pseudomonadota bacterium]
MAEAPATTPDLLRPTSVGTLWTGGALTWLEHLTLAAMRDAGLPVALFAYRDPGPLPEGVRLLQAAEIAAEDAAAPALLKDLFRWRLLAQAPGMIWCDLDMLLLRPPPAERGRLIVREPGERFASPAILALPPESPALSALLRFVEDPAPVPPWTAGDERAALEAARAAGEDIAAEDQPWGVWGARALTWFLEESGEAEDALGPEAAFPLPRGEEGRLNARRADLSDLAHEGTFALPLRAAALKRDLIAGGTGLPRYWSFLGDRLRRHGVSPRAAPIPGAPAPPAHLWVERGAAQSPRSAAKTKAAPAGRVLIVTTMKNEGPFLLEWIAYHRSIGVTDFIVYTNDCDDGTDEFHDLLARKGIVAEHLDNPFRSMNGVKPQHAAYWNAQTRPVTAEADWVIPMDVDEFVNVHAGEGRFQDLLDAVPDANMISMTWRLFGNGFVGGFEDRFVLDQFEWCAHERTRKPHQAWGFKTAFRNIGLYRKFGVHRP